MSKIKLTHLPSTLTPDLVIPDSTTTLYLDLNSCFATIEQQSRPRLRGKPVAITNRSVPNSCIIAASHEAKQLGVKVGMRRLEATQLCPRLIFAEAEPSKYIYIHEKLKSILSTYSPDLTMKSIDEGVIDLASAPRSLIQAPPQLQVNSSLHPPSPAQHPLINLAHNIKTRIRQEIGDYMRCNIGLASNRFLAKLAAELHKPDGLDIITPANQRQVFQYLKLTDLPGINLRLERRLDACQIYTPLQFLDANPEVLAKQVFHSIDGYKWHQRLHGVEVDNLTDTIKSIGRQYALESKLLTRSEVLVRLAHLCEDVGHRLRHHSLYARGVRVWLSSYDGEYLHRSQLAAQAFNTDQAIISLATQIFQTLHAHPRIIGVTLYKLQNAPPTQVSFFHHSLQKTIATDLAADSINHRFGTRTIHSAYTLPTNHIKTKIPFGSTRHLDHSIV